MVKYLSIKGDKVIWTIAIVLSIASLLLVYSSTELLAARQKTFAEYFLTKQTFIVISGLFMLYLAHLIKFVYYSRLGQILFIITIPLLILTLFVAPDINNAQRSIRLNIPMAGTISFQPFDLAKISLMLYLARFLSKFNNDTLTFKKFFWYMGAPLLLVSGLILRSNFSTAAMLFMVCFLMLIIGNVRINYLFKLMGIAVAGFLVLLIIGRFYPEVLPRAGVWVNRIESYLAPHESQDEEVLKEVNPQVLHSKIAIAEGGLFGKMPGKSTQRIFLPEVHNDFIYAIVVEEYGLIGGMVVLLLFVILMFRTIRVARRCDSPFGTYLALGFGFLIVWQALINMAVAVHIMPVTGQPLPFLSMGGTAFWYTCISVGIILSVSRSNQASEKELQTLSENIENGH